MRSIGGHGKPAAGRAADTIEFGAGLPLVAGKVVLLPATAYPSITDTLMIDGYTAAGYALADPWADPIFELNGGLLGGGNGLAVSGSDGSVIRGLAIHGFPGAGITVSGSTSNLVVQACHVGVSQGMFFYGPLRGANPLDPCLT